MHPSISTQRRRLRACCGIVAAVIAVAGAAHAQTPAPAGPRAVGVSILHLNVSSLERSLALYRDVLGMELTAPLAPPRAGTGLVIEAGARLQTVILRVPGGTFQMELVEWSGVALRAHQPRIQDPGEIMLAMNVRNLDTMLAAAKKLGLRILSAGGEPYVSEARGGGRNRAVMVRDPDGFIVELVDTVAAPPVTASPASGPITSVNVYLTVQDLAQTVNFYNRAFGFTMAAPAAAAPTSARVKALFNDPSLATMRTARGTFPGSEFTINFQEFGVTDRKPARHRVQDPGGPILLVQVQDFPAVLEQVRANGGIIGQGDSSETLPAEARSAWVRDPNGMLLRISPPAAPRGTGAATPPR